MLILNLRHGPGRQPYPPQFRAKNIPDRQKNKNFTIVSRVWWVPPRRVGDVEDSDSYNTCYWYVISFLSFMLRASDLGLQKKGWEKEGICPFFFLQCCFEPSSLSVRTLNGIDLMLRTVKNGFIWLIFFTFKGSDTLGSRAEFPAPLPSSQ